MAATTIQVETDTIEVSTITHDYATGRKLEPEEKPARRILGTTTELGLSGTGETVGGLHTDIVAESTAIEMAQGAKSICMLCKHFDSNAWHAYRAKLMATKEGIQILNRLRAQLILTGNAGADDDSNPWAEDPAVLACGICRPLTEASRRPVIAYPASTCPAYLSKDNGEPDYERPFPCSFTPKDVDAERVGNSMFDRIMGSANT